MRKKSIIYIFIFLFLTFFGTTFFQLSNFSLSKNAVNFYEDRSSQRPKTTYLDLFGMGGTKLGTRDGSRPKICSDGEGGAIICWEDGRIYAQRLNSSGDIQWIESGVAISPSTGVLPEICSDGNGGAIITWHAGSWPNHKVYTQKINSTGQLQWSVSAIPICTEAGEQATPKICVDGSGGAIIVWQDYRNKTDPSSELCDIYVQRVNSTGQTQWTPNGVLILDTSSITDWTQISPKIISDKEGGAIISWVTNNDIYAQKINNFGDIQWNPDGLAVCSAEGTQDRLTICSDELGGAYFAWVDGRPSGSNEENIYAQRVNSAGSLQWNINGTVIINKENWQRDVKICEDGLGNAIITWRESTFNLGVPALIYAQKVDRHGNFYWDQQGLFLGNGFSEPHFQICCDNSGGTFIAWLYNSNYDLEGNNSICVQYVDSNGRFNWKDNGFYMKNVKATDLCMTKDNSGGCIMAWSSYLVDKYEIYIQKIRNEDFKPISNHPSDIITSEPATERIEWIIHDDSSTGQYRVLTNDSQGNDIIWINWTTWQDDNQISVTLNAQSPGEYFYTIEFFDAHNQLGLADTVLVKVELPNSPETPNSPQSIPGFELFYLIGVVFFMIFLVAIKNRK